MADPAWKLTPQEEKDLNKFQKFFSFKVRVHFLLVVACRRSTNDDFPLPIIKITSLCHL